MGRPCAAERLDQLIKDRKDTGIHFTFYDWVSRVQTPIVIMKLMIIVIAIVITIIVITAVTICVAPKYSHVVLLSSNRCVSFLHIRYTSMQNELIVIEFMIL